MSIASEITRINNNIADAYTEISNKGGTLPVTQNSANLANAIASITGGGSSNLYVIQSVSDLQDVPPMPDVVAVIYDVDPATSYSINVNAPNYVQGPFLGFPTTLTVEDDPSTWGSSPTPFEMCMYNLGANRPQSDPGHLSVSGCEIPNSGYNNCCVIEGYDWGYPYGTPTGYLTISIVVGNTTFCRAVYKQQSTQSQRGNLNTFALDTTASINLEPYGSIYISNYRPDIMYDIHFQNFTVASSWGQTLTTSFIFKDLSVESPESIAGVSYLYTFETRYNEWLEWTVSGPVQ